MDIRCSILGHDYRETEVEREREERGDEEVITLREIRECGRCGRRDLVSENKHVRAIVDESDESPSSDDKPADPTPTPADDAADTGEVIDTAGRERDRGEWPAYESESEGGPENDPSGWPDHDDDAVDEGYSAEQSDGEAPPVDFSGGLTPDATDETPQDDGSEIIEAESEPDEPTPYPDHPGDDGDDEPSEMARADTVGSDAAISEYVDLEYFCPNCDFSTGTNESSLRTGDICPECSSGYIGEREVGR